MLSLLLLGNLRNRFQYQLSLHTVWTNPRPPSLSWK